MAAAVTRRLTPAQRDALYEREKGDKQQPDCNICALPIFPGQRWDESHIKAKAFGGTETGIAHSRCNRLHGSQVVWPAVAKADRQHRRHIGAHRPGLGFRKLPGGRDDPRRKKLSGKVVSRQTGEAWR